MAKLERFRSRKNFFLTTILTIFLWICWAAVFFLIPPEYFLTPFLFLLLSFFVVLFTSSLIFANTRRGLLTTIGVILYMVLSFYGLGNYLNAFLIAGVLVASEYYFLKNRGA